MANYYIEYPIPIKCGLKCSYCFHEAFEMEKAGTRNNKYPEKCPFTIEQFLSWRDKHLSDGEEFLYELHGGEMSHPESHKIVFEILDKLDKGKFQLQTNGLGDLLFYKKLIKYKNKIDRIGLTFHRKELSDKQRIAFNYRVKFLKDNGINCYVKELLFPELKSESLVFKEFWERLGVPFRFQDFKGYRGRDGSDIRSQYTEEDYRMLDSEYCHMEHNCTCRKGYKQVLIRGYDIFAGDVLACWDDPCVVGNIMEDWYDGNYTVNKHPTLSRDVTGVKKIYRGGYPRDLWYKGIEQVHGNGWKDTDKNNREFFIAYNKQRSSYMKQFMLEKIQEWNGQIQQLNTALVQKKAECEQIVTQGIELKGRINAYNIAIQEFDKPDADKEVIKKEKEVPIAPESENSN
jgi:hypothetical protein